MKKKFSWSDVIPITCRMLQGKKLGSRNRAEFKSYPCLLSPVSVTTVFPCIMGNHNMDFTWWLWASARSSLRTSGFWEGQQTHDGAVPRASFRNGVSGSLCFSPPPLPYHTLALIISHLGHGCSLPPAHPVKILALTNPSFSFLQEDLSKLQMCSSLTSSKILRSPCPLPLCIEYCQYFL